MQILKSKKYSWGGNLKKKTRKNAFNQESDQEKKKIRSRPKKRSRKKEKNDNGQEKKKENTLSTKKATGK